MSTSALVDTGRTFVCLSNTIVILSLVFKPALLPASDAVADTIAGAAWSPQMPDSVNVAVDTPEDLSSLVKSPLAFTVSDMPVPHCTEFTRVSLDAAMSLPSLVDASRTFG